MNSQFPVLKLFWLCLLAFFTMAAPCVCFAEETIPRFPNPMTERDAADPSLLAHENSLYLYCTGCNVKGGGAYPIYVSNRDDRTSWTYVGGVFTSATLPTWGHRERCRYWAPEVHLINGRFVCYYSAWSQDERFCIGAATSMSPQGPFADIGAPLASNDEYGLIDAGYFHDSVTSRSWLMWKEDKNDLDPKQPTDIILQELTSDGLKLIGEPHVVLTNDQEWEHELVEAPSIIYRNGFYYMFYSANAFNDDRYGVGVARAREVTGPYLKLDKNPILKTNEEFNGPGHQFLFEELPGVWTMFYHARHVPSGSRQRLLMSDPVRWNEEGWPYINDGFPSRGWSPAWASEDAAKRDD